MMWIAAHLERKLSKNQVADTDIGIYVAGQLKKPKRIVDVGCGIDGSSQYLARKFGVECKCITLSPVQSQRAHALAAAEGLADQVCFSGFLSSCRCFGSIFSCRYFDLVWSMESGEHMPDNTKFVGELARVAAPGVTITIVTWCHRDLLPLENSLRPDEISLLNKICDAYYLPKWCFAADYVKIAELYSLEKIRTTDWSENVAPFWPAVIRSALTWKRFTYML